MEEVFYSQFKIYSLTCEALHVHEMKCIKLIQLTIMPPVFIIL